MFTDEIINSKTRWCLGRKLLFYYIVIKPIRGIAQVYLIQQLFSTIAVNRPQQFIAFRFFLVTLKS